MRLTTVADKLRKAKMISLAIEREFGVVPGYLERHCKESLDYVPIYNAGYVTNYFLNRSKNNFFLQDGVRFDASKYPYVEWVDAKLAVKPDRRYFSGSRITGFKFSEGTIYTYNRGRNLKKILCFNLNKFPNNYDFSEGSDSSESFKQTYKDLFGDSSVRFCNKQEEDDAKFIDELNQELLKVSYSVFKRVVNELGLDLSADINLYNEALRKTSHSSGYGNLHTIAGYRYRTNKMDIEAGVGNDLNIAKIKKLCFTAKDICSFAEKSPNSAYHIDKASFDIVFDYIRNNPVPDPDFTT